MKTALQAAPAKLPASVIAKLKAGDLAPGESAPSTSRSLGQYSLDEIRRMGPANPSGQALMEFEAMLAAEQRRRDELEVSRNFMEHNLKVVEETEAGKLLAQSQCSHFREDNVPAFGGQYDGYNVLRGSCQRCGKNFVGIGNGPENLPLGIFQRINQETIGSAAHGQ